MGRLLAALTCSLSADEPALLAGKACNDDKAHSNNILNAREFWGAGARATFDVRVAECIQHLPEALGQPSAQGR